MAAAYGISKEEIATALKTFKSVKRRLEVKAQVNGITIIDDFAHHPTAIAGTLKALRARYAQARLWAILEPRSNTLRRRVLQADLARSLALADEVIVAGVFRSDAVPVNERLDLPELAADIQKHGARARLIGPARTRSCSRLLRRCAAAMWWRFFPMAALADLRETSGAFESPRSRS
jgi:UDP-N-acetylmuramate: L-alanyl-gamma-D-glutamyl-meso-diaminopimelate ligase